MYNSDVLIEIWEGTIRMTQASKIGEYKVPTNEEGLEGERVLA